MHTKNQINSSDSIAWQEKFRHLDDQLQLKEIELSALLEVSQAVSANLSEEDLYKIFQFTLMANLQTQSLALVIDKAMTMDWQCVIQHDCKEFEPHHCIQDVFLNMQDPIRLDELDPNHRMYFKNFNYLIPIRQNQTTVAFLFLGQINASIGDIGKALNFVCTLCNILMVAVQNKRLQLDQIEQQMHKKEMQIAAQVQRLLFPKKLPIYPDFKVHASYRPHRHIGGDYYDFISIDQERVLICVADVSGKGVPAALLMSNLQASLRALASNDYTLLDIVAQTNKIICSNSNGEHFITAFLAIYNTKSHVFNYINAGHNPPVLIEAAGQMSLLEKGCTLLGIFDPLPFIEQESLIIVPGSLFIAYTDGLTEAHSSVDNQEFGLDIIIEIAHNYSPKSNLEKLHTEILNALDVHTNHACCHDDVTLISCLF